MLYEFCISVTLDLEKDTEPFVMQKVKIKVKTLLILGSSLLYFLTWHILYVHCILIYKTRINNSRVQYREEMYESQLYSQLFSNRGSLGMRTVFFLLLIFAVLVAGIQRTL